MSTLGNRLKELRANRDPRTSQDDVAKALGVSRATYANWEVGRTSPDPDTLERLATYFDVSVDYILGRLGNPRPGVPLPPFVNDLSPDLRTFLEREAAAGWPRLELLHKAELQGLTTEELDKTLRFLFDLKRREKEANLDSKK